MHVLKGNRRNSMAAKNDNNMTSVYQLLKHEGLDTRYVKRVLLPEWWNDSLASTRSGLLHGLSIISKRAGIQLAPLIRRQQQIKCREIGTAKFKRQRNAHAAHVKWAKNIGASAAEIVAELTKNPFHRPGATAAEIRRKILRKYRTKTVTLQTLLDLAWDCGIPVVFVSHLPPGFRRMAGMAVQFVDRPAIVISKKSASDGWLAFIIAHELGHMSWLMAGMVIRKNWKRTLSLSNS
jgi:hypothetical protein